MDDVRNGIMILACFAAMLCFTGGAFLLYKQQNAVRTDHRVEFGAIGLFGVGIAIALSVFIAHGVAQLDI